MRDTMWQLIKNYWMGLSLVLRSTDDDGVAMDVFREDSCLMQSNPEEPVFVLCARDSIAPYLVEMWANTYAARAQASMLAQGGREGEKLSGEELDAYIRKGAKAQNARLIARKMREWRKQNASS